MNTQPLLDVHNLQIRLPTAHGLVTAVHDLHLRLMPGQTLGLVGESGCGKSLTALALMGLLPERAQVSGSIRLEGTELCGLDEAALCRLRGNRMAMVFQEPMTALNPLHTIGQQLAEPLRLHQGLSRPAAEQVALRLLDRVGIAQAASRMDAYPHQFSGGQRQRITIAMALTCNPALLVADEPTTALDVTVASQILDLIQELVAERGMGLILISHDLGIIARHVGQLMVMYGGTAVEWGPTSTVFGAPAHPYTRGLLASRPQLQAQRPVQPDGRRSRLPAIRGTVPELHLLPPGCAFSGRCPAVLPGCADHPPPERAAGPLHHARCVLLQAPAP